MTRYVALLRAVNVGGTGKLPMAELKAMAERIGFGDVRSYIASGNLVFATPGGEAEVKAALEGALAAYAGKPVGVMVRTADEMAAVLAANPFADRAPNRVVAVFLDTAPPADTIARATGRRSEEIALGKREVYVFYGEGMAESKLKLPIDKLGTGRNLNTVMKLAGMAAESG